MLELLLGMSSSCQKASDQTKFIYLNPRYGPTCSQMHKEFKCALFLLNLIYINASLFFLKVLCAAAGWINWVHVGLAHRFVTQEAQ